MTDTLSLCRACGAKDPYLFLPLGDHPPANSFVLPADTALSQPTFALNAQACLSCGLIQVADQIPADFFKHYLYVPSGADTMHTHFAGLAKVLADLSGGGLVADIGCNDGLLLTHVNAIGAKSLGIDPAANLAEQARAKGVETECVYFGPQTAAEIAGRHGEAAVIVTTNTFNHIGDLHAFMQGVVTLLAPEGTFVIEVPWAKDLLDRNEFDTIYHEHVSMFSLLSIAKLGAFFDLDVADVHRLTVHGGSMRVFLRRKGVSTPTPEVQAMLDEEVAAGMLEAKTYDDFADRILVIHGQLRTMIDGLKAQGLSIAGYGAPAKGNTLLNYFAIGPGDLNFLVDRNPLKQGLLSPGVKIPVLSPDAIGTEKPDVLLVLAWNFFDEIREMQADFVKGGGRFLVPLPEPALMLA